MPYIYTVITLGVYMPKKTAAVQTAGERPAGQVASQQTTNCWNIYVMCMPVLSLSKSM